MGGGSVARLFDTFNITGADTKSASFTLPGSSSTSPMEESKQAVEKQMAMAQASQDALVAKEAAATADVQKAQETASSQAKAVVTNKKRAVARSSNIYTSPLGIGGTADVARKVLLGS